MSTTISSARGILPELLREFDLDGDGWISLKEIDAIQKRPQKEQEQFLRNLGASIGREISKSAKLLPEKLVPTENVSLDAYRILEALHNLSKLPNSRVIQEDIAKEARMPGPRVSSILNTMDEALVPDPAKSGWITRMENREKRHQKLISMTAAGKAVFKRAKADYDQQNAKIVSIIGLRELIQLKVCLYRLNRGLDATHSDAGFESLD